MHMGSVFLVAVLCLLTCGLTTCRLIFDSREKAATEARIIAGMLSASTRIPLFADDRQALKRQADRLIVSYPNIATVTISNNQGSVITKAEGSGGFPFPDFGARQELVVHSGNFALDLHGVSEPPQKDFTLGKINVVVRGISRMLLFADVLVTAILTASIFWAGRRWQLAGDFGELKRQ